MEKKKASSKNKELNIKDVTICDATAQMLEKAKKDGVQTAFDRAAPSGRIRHAANTAGWAPAD